MKARLGLLMLVMFVSRTAADPLPVEIKPDDPKLYYVGRVDVRDNQGPRMQWSNSAVTVRFKGTNLQMKLNDGGKNFYAVTIDDQPPTVLHPDKGESVVDLAKNLPAGEHRVSVVRRTEASCGPVQFRGFSLNAGGTLLDPMRLTRKIEVIGDSISCGYGNEGASEKEHFKPETENGTLTYGALAARAVDAEYVCIAWSGRKMWPNNTVPEIYDLALPTDKTSAWDFSKWTPDVVLINLSTNDFAKEIPDEKGWTEAYETFVQRVRKHYLKADLYFATSPMMYDGKDKRLSVAKAYLEKVKKHLEDTGEGKLHLILFPTQNGKQDGLGGDWHPSLKTHQKMSDIFVAAMKQDLEWEFTMRPK